MVIMALVLGVAILFNFVILRVKWNRGQYLDAILDVVMLLVLNAIFGGSLIGAASVTAGSTLISLYLMHKPIVVESNNKAAMSGIADRIDKILRG